MADTLDKDKLEKLVDELPAFPQSVQLVINMTSDAQCEPRELVKVVEHDPVLTGRVLKVVNSAYFGLSTQIGSVKHAVVYIGLNTIKHLALSIAAVGSLPKSNVGGVSTESFLLESLGVGAVARILATRCGFTVRQSDDFFVAGLVHNIGELVLSLNHPDLVRTVRTRSQSEARPMFDVEKELFAATHFEVSAMVAEKWQMPDNIVEAIRYYRKSPAEMERTPLMDCLLAAKILIKSLNPTAPQMRFPTGLSQRLGFRLDQLLMERQHFEAAIEKVKIFMDVTGG
jgi:HD-like signal output (HDOD) protein